jgi:hypothetical protein
VDKGSNKIKPEARSWVLGEKISKTAEAQILESMTT